MKSLLSYSHHKIKSQKKNKKYPTPIKRQSKLLQALRFSFCFISLIIVILSSSCAVNIARIQKSVETGVRKQEISAWEKHLVSDKVSDDLKISLIKELSLPQYAQPFVNDYLVNNLYPRYKGIEAFEREIINGIIQQQEINNTDFFMELIKEDHPQKSDIKKAVVAFNLDGFHRWKHQLPTAEGLFRQDLYDILDELPNKGINHVLIMFIENDSFRDQLLDCFLHFESETIRTIFNFLKNDKINSFSDIEEIIDPIGSKQLISYQDIFYSDNENTVKILRNIYVHFGDESLITMDMIHPLLTEISARLIVYQLCEEIDSIRSFQLLERFMERVPLAIERKEIISHLVNLTDSFPPSLIQYLDRPDVNIYVVNSLDKFLETNPASVLQAFRNASNVGKNVLLKALFYEERASERMIKDIFAMFEQLNDSVKEYLIYCLTDKSHKDYYYDFVIHCLTSSNDKLYSPAIGYCRKHPAVFNDYIIGRYPNLSGESEEKTIELISYFENTTISRNLSFLHEHFVRNYEVNDLLAHQYGSLLINNYNLTELTNVLNREYGNVTVTSVSSQDRKKIERFVYLLSLSKNHQLNNRTVITDKTALFYPHLSLDEKLTMINFTVKSNNIRALKFLIDHYPKMTCLEKRIFNSSLNYFATEDIIRHLERITYLKDDVDFHIIKDLLYSRYSNSEMSDRMLKLFIFNYFRANRFTEAEEYIAGLTNPSPEIEQIVETMKYWQLSEIFKEDYRKHFGSNQINFLYVYKSVLESLLASSFLTDYYGTKEDAAYYRTQKAQFNEQFDLLRKTHKAYFDKLDRLGEGALQSNFLVTLLSAKYSYSIKHGIREYRVPEGKVFLHLEALIENVYPEPMPVDIRDFAVQTDGENHRITRENLEFARFRGDMINFIQHIQPNNNIILQLLFAVPVNDETYYLVYDNEWSSPISTPIQIPSLSGDTYRVEGQAVTFEEE